MKFLQWWNLVFILPFFTAVASTLLLASGMIAHGDGDADHDVSIDHDFDHGIEGGYHDIEHEREGFGLKVLSFLGFGKVPISILLTSFCYVWGFSGFVSNIALESALKFPFIYFWFSVFNAGFLSVFSTKYLAKGIAAVMPSTETYGLKNEDFVGKIATVRYPITEKSGAAWFYDQHKTLQEVPCRVFPGEEIISLNMRVVLMRYDGKERAFFVSADPLKNQKLRLKQ